MVIDEQRDLAFVDYRLKRWYFFLFLLAMFPILYDCCTEVAHHIPRRWLRRNVLMFEIQKGVVQKRRFCLLIFGMSVAYVKFWSAFKNGLFPFGAKS
uniref:Uncharacterized protein n=1 Tax=Varanus komodoensis TaxID=61221 RepID=A0A8D2KQZ9_VARKO